MPTRRRRGWEPSHRFCSSLPGRHPPKPDNGLAGVYGGRWTGRVLVLTHRGDTDDESVDFIDGPIDHAVHRALAVAGGLDVVVFGANVAHQVLAPDCSTRS